MLPPHYNTGLLGGLMQGPLNACPSSAGLVGQGLGLAMPLPKPVAEASASFAGNAREKKHVPALSWYSGLTPGYVQGL